MSRISRILVTGAGTRIGQQISLALAKAGHHVIVHYHCSDAGAQTTKTMIEQAGGTADLVQADLRQPQACLDLLDTSGPLTGLINNASLFEPDELGNVSETQWDQHFAINVKAPVFLAQGFAAQLPKTTKGHIINLLDQRLSKLNPTFFSYTLSKAALATATTTMAQALAPDIQVNAIAPGPTLRNARQNESDFARQQQTSLLGKGSAPDEIVKAVLFLLQSKAITGQILTVDGGQHLLWETADIAGVTE